LPGEVFTVGARPAFVMLPAADKRSSPQPWIFYAPTLPGYPDEHERWMHEQFLVAGVAVAGIDVGESYGSPAGRKLFDDFYSEMVGKRSYATRPCLLARSRGGLWMSSWAADHPERVAGIAGIYPAFDLRTYPGLDQAAPAYGMKPQELAAALDRVNPIERVESLAVAKVPVFIIHGDRDDTVPLAANSAELVKRYEAQGAKPLATLVVPAGQGHSFWEGYFHCQELVDFAISRARAGGSTAAP
jgi:pimeloyl-ACP methyl ester carboxylesterase